MEVGARALFFFTTRTRVIPKLTQGTDQIHSLIDSSPVRAVVTALGSSLLGRGSVLGVLDAFASSIHHPRRICSSLAPPPPHFVSPEHAPFACFPSVRSQGDAVLNRAVELYSTMCVPPDHYRVNLSLVLSAHVGESRAWLSITEVRRLNTHQITLPYFKNCTRQRRCFAAFRMNAVPGFSNSDKR